MNREKFCSTAKYKVLRNELNAQKYILRNLDKDNVTGRESCLKTIEELKKEMRIK